MPNDEFLNASAQESAWIKSENAKTMGCNVTQDALSFTSEIVHIVLWILCFVLIMILML